MPSPRRTRSMTRNARRLATAQPMAVLAASLNAASPRRATRARPVPETRAANLAALAAVSVPRRPRTNTRLRNELSQLRLERQEELNRLHRQLTQQHNAALARAVNQRQANVRSALLSQFNNMSRQINSRAVNRGRAQANANSKRKFENAINKLKMTMRNAGYSRQYSNLFNAIKRFSSISKNSPPANLRRGANNVVNHYFVLPGGSTISGLRKPLLAKNLKELVEIYSNKHAKAIYNSAINKGTREYGRAQPIVRGIARALPVIMRPGRALRRA